MQFLLPRLNIINPQNLSQHSEGRPGSDYQLGMQYIASFGRDLPTQGEV